MCKIVLKEFEKFSNSDLVKLFDHVYKKDPRTAGKLELANFRAKTNLWCRDMNAEFFGIYRKIDLVGTISLSKQNKKEKQANVGYEIFNEFRGKGFASKAFQLMIKIAFSKGFLILKSKILKENRISINIWKNSGATFKESDHDKLDVTLPLR